MVAELETKITMYNSFNCAIKHVGKYTFFSSPFRSSHAYKNYFQRSDVTFLKNPIPAADIFKERGVESNEKHLNFKAMIHFFCAEVIWCKFSHCF